MGKPALWTERFQARVSEMVPIRISPYRPAAWMKPHHEAGHTTAPDHMPKRDRKNCLHLTGRPHTSISRTLVSLGSDAICSHRQFFRWRTRCRQFANVTARFFGGLTMRPGWKAISISENIARLTGFRSRRSAIGVRSSRPSPQPPARKLLYRRGGLSHALSHGLSHGLSHDLPGAGPILPPAREGRRRRFSEADV